MKKIILAILCVSLAFISKGQVTSAFCVQVNCPITITLPLDSAQLLGVATATSDTAATYKWSVTGAGGTLSTPAAATTWVKGLNTPGTYTYSLTVTTKHGSVLTNSGSVVTVLAAPAAPRVVTSIQISIDGIMVTIPLAGSKIGFGDGTTQQN